jgi:two-component system response regulator DegU
MILTMKIPKIIIVDDHQIFRQGLKNLINVEKLGNVIGEAANGIDLLEMLSDHKPDLILLDIDMPEMNGLETIQRALIMHPNLKIIAFTMFDNEEYLYQMIEAGAIGFLLKSSGIDELEKAIRLGAAGEKYYSFKSAHKNMNNFGR